MSNVKLAKEITGHIVWTRQRQRTAKRIVEVLDARDAEISRLMEALSEAHLDALALIREDVYAAKKLYEEAEVYHKHCDKCL
jgi:hypothetical protein